MEKNPAIDLIDPREKMDRVVGIVVDGAVPPPVPFILALPPPATGRLTFRDIPTGMPELPGPVAPPASTGFTKPPDGPVPGNFRGNARDYDLICPYL